jgi:signal transduction histidine kinase
MRFYVFHGLLLVRAFEVTIFATLSWLGFREWRRREAAWGGLLFSLLSLAVALEFASELVDGLIPHSGAFYLAFLVVWTLDEQCLAPMLLHLFFQDERRRRPLAVAWPVVVGVLYATGAVALATRVSYRVSQYLPAGRPQSFPYDSFSDVPLLMALAASMLLVLGGYRKAAEPADRTRSLWILSALGALLLVRLGLRFGDDLGLTLLLNTVPAYLAFVLSYFFFRAAFFDILVKRIAFSFLALTVASSYFAAVPPWLRRVEWGSYELLVWSLSVWPLVILAPWTYARLARWLDVAWLGRRYTPIDAGRLFLAGIQGAATEPELAGLAQARLSEIFSSQAEVSLSGAPLPGLTGALEARIVAGGIPAGVVRLVPRPGGLAFLSEDLVLLRSLTETFSVMLDNLRLRASKYEHERREQELRLLASRSELKALRAEINPHFLFNALSVIAGLIRRAPDRAETTVEQLAEVFRYTLRRSDREWVRLEEELDFVRAYLDVEQARYGSRLRVRMEVEDRAKAVWVPAMVVQVLVENAIQHGIAPVRGPGAVEIRASLSEARLLLEVLDTGAGFPSEWPGIGGSQSGYGLRNIQERLSGYFGDEAGLKFGCTELNMTSVRVELPAGFAPRGEEALAG